MSDEKILIGGIVLGVVLIVISVIMVIGEVMVDSGSAEIVHSGARDSVSRAFQPLATDAPYTVVAPVPTVGGD